MSEDRCFKFSPISSHTFLLFFHQQNKEERMKCKDITKQNSSFALDVSVSVHYRLSKITVSGAASSMSDSETSGEGGQLIGGCVFDNFFGLQGGCIFEVRHLFEESRHLVLTKFHNFKKNCKIRYLPIIGHMKNKLRKIKKFI